MPPHKAAPDCTLCGRFGPCPRIPALSFFSMRAAALQLLLPVVLGSVIGLVIDVDVASLDVGERLELDL